jgi:hypothetical protein
MTSKCNANATVSLGRHRQIATAAPSEVLTNAIMGPMPALQTIYRTRIERADRILEPSGQKLASVKETTMYPAQFPILLRERLQGKTVAEAAEFLGIPPKDVNRLLGGHWRPSKAICNKMGLKVVYALTEQPKSPIS